MTDRWALVFVLALTIVLAAWMLRFAPLGETKFLDRWTGNLVYVHTDTAVAEWFSLLDPKVDSSAELRARIDVAD
jgi:hypothetical protein